MRSFGTDQAFADRSAPLAANQGLYNGFLVAGLVWGLIAADPVGFQVTVFFLACVIVAGLYGAATVSRRILIVQASLRRSRRRRQRRCDRRPGAAVLAGQPRGRRLRHQRDHSDEPAMIAPRIAPSVRPRRNEEVARSSPGSLTCGAPTGRGWPLPTRSRSRSRPRSRRQAGGSRRSSGDRQPSRSARASPAQAPRIDATMMIGSRPPALPRIRTYSDAWKMPTRTAKMSAGSRLTRGRRGREGAPTRGGGHPAPG